MYRSASGRARAVVRGLVAVVVIDILVAIVSLNDYFIIARELDEPGRHLDAVDTSDTVQGVAGLAQLVVFVAVAVLWVRWQQRAYRDLPALGITEPRYTTGQTGWSWFIPFLNLVRPKKVANDLWRSGQVGAPRQDPAWSERPLAGVLTTWWALWLLASLVGNAVGAAFADAETLEDYQVADLMDVISSGMDIVAVIPAFLVVTRITARQERRREELGDPPAPPTPAGWAPPTPG